MNLANLFAAYWISQHHNITTVHLYLWWFDLSIHEASAFFCAAHPALETIDMVCNHTSHAANLQLAQ